MSSKRVLIVILNYLTYELTLELVKDLKLLNYSDYSILVIDNASPNDSGTVLEQSAEDLGYSFIKNSYNAGYAAGNNIGIRYSLRQGYDYTWILNNDVRIEDKDCLSKLVAVTESKINIGCIGPQIKDLDRKVCPPYCVRPSVWDMTFGIYGQKKRRIKNINVEGYVYRVHGCCMLLKNSVMSAIDCMDERTFLFREEEILSERMLKSGFKCYYYPKTYVVHMESSSVNRVLKKDKKKLNIILDSYKLYLSDYREYSKLTVSFCLAIRKLQYYLRG